MISEREEVKELRGPSVSAVLILASMDRIQGVCELECGKITSLFLLILN